MILITPVQRIDSRLPATAPGDLYGRVDVPNRDELGALSANVNRMSGLINQATVGGVRVELVTDPVVDAVGGDERRRTSSSSSAPFGGTVAREVDEARAHVVLSAGRR